MAAGPITFLVPQGDILTVAAIAAEEWDALVLCDALQTPELAIKWLAKRRLLHNYTVCQQCHIPCSLVTHSRGIDGCQWQCRICHHRISVRNNSFFSGSHLSLMTIMCIVYFWCHDLPQVYIVHETKVSPRIIVDWCNFCRGECAKYFEANPTVVGGFDDNGQPLVVEIDESKYFHRKYHRGTFREGHWVFGGVECQSKKCFLKEVPDRTAGTLEALIQETILPGTHIISDGWAAYNNISRLNNGVYMHSVVIHQDYFVDPLDPDIHTQNVENMWMRAKRKLKHQYGTSRPLFPTYLQEFAFRNSYTNAAIFSNFLVCLGQNYA